MFLHSHNFSPSYNFLHSHISLPFIYFFAFVYFLHQPGSLFYFCILFMLVRFLWYFLLLYILQFTVNYRNTSSSFSICFPKYDLHQIKFNCIQSLFSFAQRTPVDYCKVYSHSVLLSVQIGKFSQMLSSVEKGTIL